MNGIGEVIKKIENLNISNLEKETEIIFRELNILSKKWEENIKICARLEEDKNLLTIKNESYQKELKELKAKVKKNEKDIKEKDEDIKNLTSENEEKKEDIEEKKRAFAELYLEKGQIIRENQNLQERITEKAIELEEKEAETEITFQINKSLKEKNKLFISENEKLTKELNRLSEENRELEEVKQFLVSQSPRNLTRSNSCENGVLHSRGNSSSFSHHSSINVGESMNIVGLEIEKGDLLTKNKELEKRNDELTKKLEETWEELLEQLNELKLKIESEITEEINSFFHSNNKDVNSDSEMTIRNCIAIITNNIKICQEAFNEKIEDFNYNSEIGDSENESEEKIQDVQENWNYSEEIISDDQEENESQFEDNSNDKEKIIENGETLLEITDSIDVQKKRIIELEKKLETSQKILKEYENNQEQQAEEIRSLNKSLGNISKDYEQKFQEKTKKIITSHFIVKIVDGRKNNWETDLADIEREIRNLEKELQWERESNNQKSESCDCSEETNHLLNLNLSFDDESEEKDKIKKVVAKIKQLLSEKPDCNNFESNNEEKLAKIISVELTMLRKIFGQMFDNSRWVKRIESVDNYSQLANVRQEIITNHFEQNLYHLRSVQDEKSQLTKKLSNTQFALITSLIITLLTTVFAISKLQKKQK